MGPQGMQARPFGRLVSETNSWNHEILLGAQDLPRLVLFPSVALLVPGASGYAWKPMPTNADAATARANAPSDTTAADATAASANASSDATAATAAVSSSDAAAAAANAATDAATANAAATNAATTNAATANAATANAATYAAAAVAAATNATNGAGQRVCTFGGFTCRHSIKFKQASNSFKMRGKKR